MILFKKFNNLRKITRYLGLNSIIYKFIYGNSSYEEKFDNYFSSKISKNDIIYDIGANIGHYSKIYSKLVGSQGKVVAFEPSEKNFSILSNNCKNISTNIIAVNCGIGANREKLFLTQGEDAIGATSNISTDQNGDGNWVDIFPLDAVLDKYGIPNAIKIDVEGFELEVLNGAKLLLENKLLKVIGIEIHSEILNKKGIENGHEMIEKILVNNGFKIHYPDFSHIIGFK